MTTYKATALKKEKVILVALVTKYQSREKAKEYLDELTFLAVNLGVNVLTTFIQQREQPNVRTFIGKGKLEELKVWVKAEQVDMVIFDDELTPSQVRNLENSLQCKVLDRSLLILNIFAMRAKTAQAKTQVALAQYQYLLPRLTKLWTHLSKQKGGVGMRGPGETELETDRRIVQDKIALLRKKLQAIEKQSATQRKSRKQLVRVALVGYTNVGKSTLMRLLSKANVAAENKLFATVDSTVRKVVMHNIPFLLTDTVGFIRKLPHSLIACFKSTLDEVREADILLHVVDVSHPAFEEHMQVVHKTLLEIGAANIPILLVCNKIDQLSEATRQEEDMDRVGNAHQSVTLKALQQSCLAQYDYPTVFIAASKKENIDTMKTLLYQKVRKKYKMIYPNSLKNDVY